MNVIVYIAVLILFILFFLLVKSGEQSFLSSENYFDDISISPWLKIFVCLSFICISLEISVCLLLVLSVELTHVVSNTDISKYSHIHEI